VPRHVELLASSHPVITGAFYVALGLYALAWLITWARPAWGRWLLGAGALSHLGSTIGRGWVIDYFPLTNKFESFSAAALAVAVVTLASWQRDRLYDLLLLTLLGALLYAAYSFGLDLTYPIPILVTFWYPTHVPLSFLAYATWAAAAAAAVAWWLSGDPAWHRRIDRLALLGFGLWSVSMICGGIWGVLAWGAYFMWDPKVVWSVILWFFYASFLHVRLTPSLRPYPWVRPVLAVIGLILVFIAYVGTSFLFGGSSHAF